MGQSQRVITNTIRLILDDDASTELSTLRQLDIHLVAHAMKWAIRYSEETLVTYEDYQVLYLQQGKHADATPMYSFHSIPWHRPPRAPT